MSSHHHDHHLEGPKPVSFTVPFILACATLLVMFLFLSLCDPPKHGHDGGGHDGHHKNATGVHNQKDDKSDEPDNSGNEAVDPPSDPDSLQKPAQKPAGH